MNADRVRSGPGADPARGVPADVPSVPHLAAPCDLASGWQDGSIRWDAVP